MDSSILAVRCARVGILVLVCAVRAAAQGQVIVVDPVVGPGVDFTTVGDAVAAAADNDTVLVHAGTYDADWQVTGKSVAIVGRAGDVVTIRGSASVENLAANQFVSITGIAFMPAGPIAQDHGLELTDNAGAVWVEHCVLHGHDDWANLLFGDNDSQGGPGLQLSNCDNVTIATSSITGGSANGGNAFGGDAIVSSHSNLWLFDVTSHGGTATGCQGPCAHVPGDGAHVTGGKLFFEGSLIHGYYGIDLLSGGPALWQLDSDVKSSALDFFGDPQDPIQGSGTVTQLAGSERDFTIDTPVREGDSMTLSLAGLEGDSTWLFLALKPGGVMSAKYHGPLLVGPANLLLSIAVLPPGGTLTLHPTVPAFAPGIESLAFVLQAAFRDTGGAIYLSNPSRLVMLAAQF